jgi:hypothetical protein
MTPLLLALLVLPGLLLLAGARADDGAELSLRADGRRAASQGPLAQAEALRPGVAPPAPSIATLQMELRQSLRVAPGVSLSGNLLLAHEHQAGGHGIDRSRVNELHLGVDLRRLAVDRRPQGAGLGRGVCLSPQRRGAAGGPPHAVGPDPAGPAAAAAGALRRRPRAGAGAGPSAAWAARRGLVSAARKKPRWPHAVMAAWVRWTCTALRAWAATPGPARARRCRGWPATRSSCMPRRAPTGATTAGRWTTRRAAQRCPPTPGNRPRWPVARSGWWAASGPAGRS